MPSINNSLNLNQPGIAVLSTTVSPPQFFGRTLTTTSFSLSIANPDGQLANPIFTLAASLDNLGTLSGTGYVVKTGGNTFATRTFVAGSGISLINADGVAGNTTITAGATVPTTFTADSGTATPSGNNINLLGTAAQGISTSASGSTVTFTIANATSIQKGVASFNATNFTVTAGAVTSNNFTITAGTGLTGGGSLTLGGSTSLSLLTPVSVPNGGTGDTSLTLNGVLYGNGTSAVGVTAQGAANTVLLGNGGVPSFGTVPNAALQNSTITLSNGTNISISGSPVALGGAATINVAGPITPTSYTTNGVLYGNGTGPLQVTAQGAANTVLLGNGGIPSFGTVPNAALQNSSITFTAGSNITLSPASPATVSLGGSLTISASSSSGGGPSTVSLYEEFCGDIFSASSKNLYVGQNLFNYVSGGTSGGTGVTFSNGTPATNPGIIVFNFGGTGALGGLSLGANVAQKFRIGSGTLNITWIVQLASPGAGTIQNYAGLGLPVNTFAGGGGGALLFASNTTVNSGNYQCIATTFFGSAPATTTVNTAVAVGGGVGGFDKLQIQANAGGTSVDYIINGVTVTTITTHLPSAQSMTPVVFSSGTTGGSTTGTLIDEFDLQLVLTTPR